MDLERKNKIWSELVQAAREVNEPQREDEITVKQFQQLLKDNGIIVTNDRARQILLAKVESGELKRRIYGKYHFFSPAK